MKSNSIDSWAYPFLFCMIINKKIHIIPKNNLVSNIGFDHEATHTKVKGNRNSNLPLKNLKQIIHPDVIERSINEDIKHFYTVFSPRPTFSNLIKSMIIKATPSTIKEFAKKCIHKIRQL